MKPYGREKKVKGLRFKKDIHPKKGFINWWEAICDLIPRSTMKLKWKKEIDNEINKTK